MARLLSLLENGGQVLNNLDRAAEKVCADFSPVEVMNSVFAEPEIQVMNSFYREILRRGGSVHVGGRTIRNLLGIKTEDVSTQVRQMAEEADRRTEYLLGPFRKYLLEFPEGLELPDLDIFIEGVELESILEALEMQGIDYKLSTATGGIWKVTVYGEHGQATIVDGEQSWQVEFWAKFARRVKLVPQDNGQFQFHLETYFGSYFIYPFDLSFFSQAEAYDPQRQMAASRTLLWMVTTQIPYAVENEEIQYYTPLPSELTLAIIHNSVMKLLGVLLVRTLDLEDAIAMNLSAKIEVRQQELKSFEGQYRSSIRDVGLAMMLILSRGLDKLDSEHGKFYAELVRCWRAKMDRICDKP